MCTVPTRRRHGPDQRPGRVGGFALSSLNRRVVRAGKPSPVVDGASWTCPCLRNAESPRWSRVTTSRLRLGCAAGVLARLTDAVPTPPHRYVDVPESRQPRPDGLGHVDDRCQDGSTVGAARHPARGLVEDARLRQQAGPSTLGTPCDLPDVLRGQRPERCVGGERVDRPGHRRVGRHRSAREVPSQIAVASWAVVTALAVELIGKLLLHGGEHLQCGVVVLCLGAAAGGSSCTRPG